MEDRHFSCIKKIEKLKEITKKRFFLFFIYLKPWAAKALGIFQTRMCSFGVLMVCQSRGEISN
jgi:hypothetical protein